MSSIILIALALFVILAIPFIMELERGKNDKEHTKGTSK